MKTRKLRTDKFILSLTILIPPSDCDVQLDCSLEWDLQKLDDVKKDPLKVVMRLSDYWMEITKPYGDCLSHETRICSDKDKLSYKLCAWYTPSNSPKSTLEPTKEYAHIIKNGTLEVIRLLREYNQGVESTGTDVQIVCQGSQVVLPNNVVSSSSLAVSTAQKWLMGDAKIGSTRPEIGAFFDKFDEVIIPRAPARYTLRVTSESTTLSGFFNSTDDARHTVELRTHPHRKEITISFSPDQRDSIIEMQLRRLSVTVTVRMNFHSIAGATAFASYELISFTPIDPV